jgi:hypothetical protein
VTATSCGFIRYRDFGDCKHGTIVFTRVLRLISLSILIYTLDGLKLEELEELEKLRRSLRS